MKKEAAVRLNEMLLECYFKLHDTIDIARDNCDAEEHKAYCRGVGQVLGYLLLDVLDPIYAEHPDLCPEQIAGKEASDAPQE
ncbi:MAG: hypothetical protein U0441_05740 [Polyangiaceae bacterium]